MKVVYNLIKYPLILCFLGCLLLELIIFIVFSFTFKQVLVKNEDQIKSLLLNQADELLNSINYLIQSKLNSVENELLLFNQHMSVQYNYQLDNSKLDYSKCKIIPSKEATKYSFEKYDTISNDKSPRIVKLNTLLQDNDLETIVYYNERNNLNVNKDNLRYTICFAVSFLKTAFIKNIINKQHREKLNYTLYFDDTIFFYPANYIDDKILKTLPFYNPSILCRDEKYIFKCSSILEFKPTEKDFTLYNSIIYMDLKSTKKNIFINMCLSINDIDNQKINIDPKFLYDDEKTTENNFLCITTNLTDLLDGINQDTNYLLFNVIQYDEEKDILKVLYCSNENIYKDLSLNEDKDSNLFSSEEYGKYRIKDNSEENIVDLFHILYYEIEKNHHSKKNITHYRIQYKNNIQKIKELIKKNSLTLNGASINVSQSYINYNYNNKGRREYNKSDISENEFIYYLKPIVTDLAKINNKKNIIEKNEKYKKIIFYTITVIKITKPNETSFIKFVYLLICARIFFYSLVLEFLVVIAFYIIVFFLMRCILNPFSTFKSSIESLLDMRNKSKKEEEIIVKKNNEDEKDKKMNLKNNFYNEFGQMKSSKYLEHKKDMNKIDPKFDMTKKYMKNFMKMTSEIEAQYTNLEMKEIENIIIFLQKILLLRDENTPYQAKADFYQSISSEISKKYQFDLFKCQILIGEYYIKDKQYSKAKNELENLQIRIEQAKTELLNKDKFNEKKMDFYLLIMVLILMILPQFHL
jgi:energy-coupling factor transporter transmembrane protein EcfT